jgi:hypothetical protein
MRGVNVGWRRLAIAIAWGAMLTPAAIGNAQGMDADCGYATCSDQCDCGASTCCECSECCGWGHCTSIWGDFLYLHATGADVHHAQQQDGVGGAGTVPFGVIGRTDPGYEPGFRVGGVINLSSCSSLALAYTFYESDSVSSLLAPIIPGGGGAVGSLVHHPGAAILASAGPVNANYEIDFQLAEFEYRRLLLGDSRGWLNYSVGARYAHLEQEFFQGGVFSGGQAGVINTRTTADFDGGGALFGLDGERMVGCRGFSIYGNAGVSPIVGQFSNDFTQVNQSTDVLLANSWSKDDRFVTIVDFEAGLAWTSDSGTLRLSAGYLAQFWYNTITTPELISAVQANNYTDMGDTLSFDGLMTRVEVRF